MTKAEKAAWKWATDNRLDPYTMGRAYGEGYDQAITDFKAEIERLYEEVPEVVPGATDDRDYGNICGQEQFYEKVILYINNIIK